MKLTAAFAVLLALAMPAGAQDTAQDAMKRQLQARATEAVIWGMPAVNADLMLQAMLTRTAAKENQIVYWGKPLDWHNQTLTPNPDTIYLMAFFDTTAGPVVLEIPPGDENASLTGNVVTMWQAALEDVGLNGIDKGAGGRFVILPPGYAEAVPEGFIPLQADTYRSYALLRAAMKSHDEADVAAAVAYGRTVKVYPLAAASSPPETVFVDAAGVDFDSTIPSDMRFFESLDRVVQSGPWIERDRAMIDQLRSIGIEKGKPFAPDEAAKAVLLAALAEARGLLEERYNQGFPPFWENSRWTMPTLQEAIEGQGSNYGDRDRYAVDARALLYTYGYISLKRPGTAQFYLITLRDKDGNALDGGQSYRLHVPAGVPVRQYWSVTAYDRQTHALIRNMERASLAANASGVLVNEDGSTDVYFGPTAPAGRESNWVPTDPQRGFELMFRVYGPTKEFFDKAWVLSDVEKVQ